MPEMCVITYVTDDELSQKMSKALSLDENGNLMMMMMMVIIEMMMMMMMMMMVVLTMMMMILMMIKILHDHSITLINALHLSYH